MTPEEILQFKNLVKHEFVDCVAHDEGQYCCLDEEHQRHNQIIDFINNLLKSRQEKMIDWLDKQDENSPEYETIFQTIEEDYCTCDFQNGDIIITDKENKHTKCGKRFLLSKPIQTSFSKLKEKIINLIKA